MAAHDLYLPGVKARVLRRVGGEWECESETFEVEVPNAALRKEMNLK